ncbi:DivIVA domain-containing protein [Herbiconiux daphne]|uniref:Cell wall synthesis protein Wag31 n=1 Tax=Herbiconiux daphne TaxID=2970914 RepID=A0ABT2H0Q7_9MICO|nr:DivIVA domain-containing protein [Herbiconiux daphne]MCS5733509.1 DivIVA domain-containing protein [Herbiconiux daphne]
MALTPEDVVNKRFSQTKFREGYDQDEVDDFLDEVVVELRRLTQENEELKAQLAAGGSAPAAAAPVETAAVVEEVVEVPAPAPVAEPVAAAPAPVNDVDDETGSTTNLLQLARRLHDEHVKEGAEKRDALIAEGHATAARIIAEAETKQRNELARLNQEKAGIEHRIDELRTFEKDYRAGLKTYIEDQLKDLTSSSVDNEKSPSSSFSGFGG